MCYFHLWKGTELPWAQTLYRAGTDKGPSFEVINDNEGKLKYKSIVFSTVISMHPSLALCSGISLIKIMLEVK